MTNITVDESKCIGCGTCVASYPENFDFNNETGLSTVISNENASQEMQTICPVGAIAVTESDPTSPEESE